MKKQDISLTGCLRVGYNKKDGFVRVHGLCARCKFHFKCAVAFHRILH